MSHEYYKRGRNWYTAIGALFIIMAGIVLVRQVILWGPEFMQDFIFNTELTNEKVSVGMIGFGIFMIIMGFKKNDPPR
jgi:multisubunit Na+/H+ antiporter MnhB subunit